MEVNSQELGSEIPAGIRIRFAAAFFDGLLLGMVINLMVFLLNLTTGIFGGISNPVTSLAIFYTFSLLLVAAYFIYFDITKGATLGKSIYGLRVVDISTGQNLNIGKATLREVVMRVVGTLPFVGLLFYIINFFVTMSSPTKRGIHDKLANSQVLVVGKSWPIFKQLGLFVLLIIIPMALYFVNMQSYVSRPTNTLNSCILKCMGAKDLRGLTSAEAQTEAESCKAGCEGK